MEAFEYADRKTADFYKSQKRLATEHPVFEDYGQGRGGADRPDGAEGALMASFTVVRIGAARRRRMIRRSVRCWRRKKSWSRRSMR